MALSDCPKCWDTPCTCGYNLSAPIKAKMVALERERDHLNQLNEDHYAALRSCEDELIGWRHERASLQQELQELQEKLASKAQYVDQLKESNDSLIFNFRHCNELRHAAEAEVKRLQAYIAVGGEYFESLWTNVWNGLAAAAPLEELRREIYRWRAYLGLTERLEWTGRVHLLYTHFRQYDLSISPHEISANLDALRNHEQQTEKAS